MPKSKKQQSAAAGASPSKPEESASRESAADPADRSKSQKRTGAVAAGIRKAGAKKKSGSAAKSKKQPGESEANSGQLADPSDSEIQLRAYFIAERRIQQGLDGDSAHDWLEAKKQLLEEAGMARA